MADYRTLMTDDLFRVISALKTPEDCYKFFDDICTIKEIQDMAQRLQVAVLLSKGKSYLEVSALTGVSTATISRVSKCLSYGTGGYADAISILTETAGDKNERV